MNPAYNVFLLTAAAGLVVLGVNTISTDLVVGSVEVVLGIVAYLVYELTPNSK